MTWEEMCVIEPRLIGVEEHAKAMGVDEDYENYESVKDFLDSLVGWGAQNEALATPGAWDTAMEHLIPLVCP